MIDFSEIPTIVEHLNDPGPNKDAYNNVNVSGLSESENPTNILPSPSVCQTDYDPSDSSSEYSGMTPICSVKSATKMKAVTFQGEPQNESSGIGTASLKGFVHSFFHISRLHKFVHF